MARVLVQNRRMGAGTCALDRLGGSIEHRHPSSVVE
jgi:hypothetical protein